MSGRWTTARYSDIFDIKEAIMTDLLIRDIDPRLKRRIEERARKNNRSLSDEAKEILSRGISRSADDRKLGTLMFGSIKPEYRGDDLVFEYNGEFPKPPDFD